MGYMNWRRRGNHRKQTLPSCGAVAYDKAALVNNVRQLNRFSNGLCSKVCWKPKRERLQQGDRGDLTYNIRRAQRISAAKQLGMDTIEVTLITSDAGSAKVVADITTQIQRTLPGVTVDIKSVPLKNRLELQRADDSTSSSEHGAWLSRSSKLLKQYMWVEEIFGNYSSEAYDKAVAEVKTTYATKRRTLQTNDCGWRVMSDVAIAPIYRQAKATLKT